MPAHRIVARAARRCATEASSSTQARMMWWAIATGGGVVRPSGCRRSSISATSSRSNQRASSSSVRSTTISFESASAWQPIISDVGKRPGLRREIGDAAAHDARLLAHLAPHRLLDGLARLDEAREARPHGGGEAAGAAEHAAIARDRQHDDDRIGARKMLGLAGRAIALPAGLDDWSARRNSSRTDGAHASAAAPWLPRAAASARPRPAPARRSSAGR